MTHRRNFWVALGWCAYFMGAYVLSPNTGTGWDLVRFVFVFFAVLSGIVAGLCWIRVHDDKKTTPKGDDNDLFKP